MGLAGRILAWLMGTWFLARGQERPLASVGLHLDRRWASDFLAGALGGAGLMVLAAGLIWLGGGCHFIRTPGSGLPALLRGAWLFLGVAVYEELMFRGYPFQHLIKRLGPWPAQGILAVAFALAHWGNPGMHGATLAWASLNIGLASILLGLCYLRKRSLALPMGLHLGWNWAQGSLLGFGVSGTAARGWWTPVMHGRPEWLTGGAFGLEASLPCAVVCLLACAALCHGIARPRAAWVPPPQAV